MFGDLIQQEQQPTQEKTELETQIERILSSPELDLQSFRLRHSGATNIRWLQNQEFCEIGVGAIGGTKVPFQIDLGLEKGTLVDPDGVEFHNLSSQGYDLVHLGMPKVKALQEKVFRHSGIKLDIREEKVERESCQSILSTYDIVSLNVDNMEIRNHFWNRLQQMCASSGSTLPELIIDSRMTLGTYTTIILPIRKMAQYNRDWAFEKVNKIIIDHCFSDEEGLQEDCAARTIIYTVTHLSSYICAFLDWYSREGNIENLKGMFDNQSNIPFKTVYSFDVRNWTALTKSRSELRLRDQVSELLEENEKLKRAVTELSKKPKEEKSSEVNIQPAFDRTYTVTTIGGFRVTGLLFDVSDKYVKIYAYHLDSGFKYYFIPRGRIDSCVASDYPASEELKMQYNRLLPPGVTNPEIKIEDLEYSTYLVLWDTQTIEVIWHEEELDLEGIKTVYPVINFFSENREIHQDKFSVLTPVSLEKRIKGTGREQFTISIGDIIVNGDNEVTYTVVSSDERFVTIRNNDREININHQQLIDGVYDGTFSFFR